MDATLLKINQIILRTEDVLIIIEKVFLSKKTKSYKSQNHSKIIV